MLHEIQNADDPYRKWPKAQLLTAIGIPLKTKNILCNVYWKDENFVSLRNVFELVVSEKTDPRPGYIVSGLISLRTIGLKTFMQVTTIFSNTDMGPKCNAEWKRRYQELTAAKRIVRNSNEPWSIANPLL